MNIPQAARHLLCLHFRQHSVRPVVSIARWIPKFSLSALLRVGIGLALVACLLVDAAGWVEFRALTQLELWAYDARLRLFMPEDARPARRHPRHRREEPERRGPLAVEPRQAGADDPPALRAVQGARRGLRRRVRRARHRARASRASKRSRRSELKDDAPIPGLPRSGARLARLRPPLRRRDRQVSGGARLLPRRQDRQVGRAAACRPSTAKRSRRTLEFRQPRARATAATSRLLQTAGDRRGPPLPALDFDGVTRRVPIFMQVRRRLLRGDVARRSLAPTSATCRSRLETCGRRLRASDRGMDPLRCASATGAHPARRAHGGARALPRPRAAFATSPPPT